MNFWKLQGRAAHLIRCDLIFRQQFYYFFLLDLFLLTIAKLAVQLQYMQGLPQFGVSQI